MILKKIKENYFKDYDKERDYPYLDKTTKGWIDVKDVEHF